MGATQATTKCPTSHTDPSASTTFGTFSQDEVLTMVDEARQCADIGKELPPLVQAAATAGVAGARRYMQEGGGLWSRDSTGRTPLHWAAGVGSEWLVEALLALGADAGARDRRGGTPLHHAAAGRGAGAAGVLLAAGAEPAATDSGGRSPLMCAAAAGNAPLCHLLAGDGPGLEATDHFKQTALHLAARNGRAAAVKALLAQGASVNATDDENRVPLHSAFIFHRDMREEALLARSWPQRRDGNRRADAEGEEGDSAETTRQVVEALLAATGALESVCHRDNLGLTPLVWALRLRLPAVAKALISVYRPDYSTDYFGKTALHWAAVAGNAYIVRRLLEHAFSPWKPDMTGCDSLMLAVESRDVETVKEILSGRKFAPRRNWMGQTALHIAVSYRDVEITRCLLELGAKFTRDDLEGRTPLFRALEKGEAGREVARLLLSAGAYRLQRRRTDKRDRTLLHAAAEGGDAEMVRELLQLGAHPQAMDAEFETPLALALRLRRRAAAAVLMEGRYLYVSRDRRGRTPLHWAAAAGWREEARTLHGLGCDPARCDLCGRSPIMAAAEHGHWQLVKDMCQWTRPKQYSRVRT